MIVAVIVGLLGTWATERNRVYQTEIGLWEDVVKKNSSSQRPFANLAAAWILKGGKEGYENGLRFIQIAESKPSNQGINAPGEAYYLYYNASICYQALGNLETSYTYAHTAAVLHRDTVTLTQLGVILRLMGYSISPDGKSIVRGKT